MIRLSSGNFGDWADTLISLLHFLGHFLGHALAEMGCSWSAMVLVQVVHVRWQPHEYQDPRFSSRTLHCNKMISYYFHYSVNLNLSPLNTEAEQQ